jgi:hypothetical protein
MDKARWSDKQLRDFVRRAHSHSWWEDSTDSDREAEHENFRNEVRRRIVAGVQSRLLEKVGSLTDPDGIAAIADDLVGDCGREDERRWLIVSPAPWDYLTAWVASELVRAYKSAAGAKPKSSKGLKRLDKELKL